MKPRIGITSGVGRPGWEPEGRHWSAYADAVREAGGEPVYLCREFLGEEARRVAGLHGLLFTGGRDIDLAMYPNPPELHGEDPARVMERFRMQPEPLRDAYEFPLLHAALDRDLPILGICRGCQVLYVGLGGRLVLDIPLETGTPVQHAASPPPDERSAFHPLEIQPGTRLAEILDPSEYRECNSRHHQSARPEPGLPVQVSAVCPTDGIVEAIEAPGRRWVIGVQWHPEHRSDPVVRERFRPLFRAFVEAAS